MNKKISLSLLTVIAVVMFSVSFASCGSDDDSSGGVGLSDSEIMSMIQGTWDVSHNGRKQVWTFSGNNVRGIYGSSLSSTFAVSNGVLVGKAFEGGIVLTKLTNTSFEAYYMDDSSERYSGVKR